MYASLPENGPNEMRTMQPGVGLARAGASSGCRLCRVERESDMLRRWSMAARLEAKNGQYWDMWALLPRGTTRFRRRKRCSEQEMQAASVISHRYFEELSRGSVFKFLVS